MKGNLARCLEYVFEDEGGFAVVATEPGGSVNLGVSMETFVAWRHKKDMLPPTIEQLQKLTREEASQIYEALYWVPIGGDELPLGVDYIALDIAINSGVGACKKIMAAAEGADDLILRACGLRLDRMLENDMWWKYKRGWFKRILHSYTRAKLMEGESA